MILVTGASGFLGSAIANRAKRRGLAVRGMIRPGSPRHRLQLAPGDLAIGEMENPESLAAAVEGVGAVIHCAASTSVSRPDLAASRRVNVEGLARLIEACQRAGTRRFVLISSQSADPRNPSVYGRTKYEAERRLRESSLEWTILRPALIYGPGDAAVFGKVVEFTRKFPVVPVLGSGRQRQRPVHVDEVAWAALRCLETPASIGKRYDLGGAEFLEFNDMLRELLRAQGLRKPLVHLPLWLCMALARILERVSSNPPVTVDNVLGVQLDAEVDNAPAERDLGFRPRSFRDAVGELFAP